MDRYWLPRNSQPANRNSGICQQPVSGEFSSERTPHEPPAKEVIIENDANAAAYGEYKAGALRGADNAVAITLGTGVGSGIILNGSVYSGSNFAGGEMGHTVIAYNGRLCTCGRRGCWKRILPPQGLFKPPASYASGGSCQKKPHVEYGKRQFRADIGADGL